MMKQVKLLLVECSSAEGGVDMEMPGTSEFAAEFGVVTNPD